MKYIAGYAFGRPVEITLYLGEMLVEYKVITSGNANEVWARGFYGESGKEKAERMLAEGYWHRWMYEADKHKTLQVVEV